MSTQRKLLKKKKPVEVFFLSMQLNQYTLSVLYYIMFIASLKMNNLLLQPSIFQCLHAFTFAADMEFE